MDPKIRPLTLLGKRIYKAFMFDASERQRTISTQQRLNMALKFASLGCWDFDIVTRQIFLDEKAQSIYGFTDHDCPGTFELIFLRVHPEDRMRVQRERDEAIKGRGVFDSTYRIIRSDGTIHKVHSIGQILFDKSGQAYAMSGVVSDLTERFLAEERFLTFFEQSTFPMQIYDLEGFCLETNKAWEGLYQADRENLQGYNVLHDPQLEKLGITPYLKRGFAGESLSVPPFIYDPSSNGKPGRARWIEGFLYPIRDKVGSVREVVLVLLDATDRIESQKELESRKHSLEKALKARNTLMGICGHELRTPLSGLKLQTQIVQRRIARGDTTVFEPKGISHLIEFYDNQIKRLVQLIDEMLDITRIESGRLQLKSEKVNFTALLHEILERLKQDFQAAASRVSLHAESNVCGYADRFRIEQVLINLLNNAIKYGKGKPVEVFLSIASNEIHIKIRDHGIGIAIEHQKRIFQPYERAVSSIEISGLGLGLYISKEIVDAHGGVITVDSAPGQGASFTVVLPQEGLGIALCEQ